MGKAAMWLRTRLRLGLLELYYGPGSGSRKFWVLARVQLRAMLASLRVGGGRKRAASGWAALALAAGLSLYMSGVYSFALARQLEGSLEPLLAVMPALAALAAAAFTVFAAQGVVFGGRDGDLLLSLPVSAGLVLGAKLTALYVENLVFCLFLTLPAGAAWLWYGGPGGALFVLRLGVGTLFLTLLPTTLSLAAGFLLHALGGRWGNRRSVNLLLYAALTAAGLAGALAVNRSAAGALMGVRPGPLMTPFWLFQRGVCGSLGALAGFCLGAAGLAGLAAALCARAYRRVLLGGRKVRTGLRWNRKRPRSPFRALVEREAARYLATPVYLMNTGLGLAGLVVGGGAAAIMGEKLRTLPLPVSPALLAAAAMGFLLSTVTITGSSVSLEGSRLWILKEAPLAAGTVLRAKAAFQLLLAWPCVLLGTAGAGWGLRLAPAEWGALLAAGLAFALCCALLGLACNLCLPKLDALNDMAVVKQSAASLAAAFGGMGLWLACAGGAWVLSGRWGAAAALGWTALALAALAAALYGWLRTRGARRFQAL